jgi:glycosyltransferase involved in cell wall biosynthesis
MGKAVKISGVIITFNEERNIERCINSLKPVCDEIVVVDSFSTDRTKEIAQGLGAIFIENKWNGFLDQKNFAQSKASHDYVLQLDADEELSDKLQSEVLRVKNDWKHDGYFFNRYTNFCGKWINHSGWYPDAKLRLYDRRKGLWSGLDPHPGVKMDEDASIGKIKGDILHYSFTSYEDLVNVSASYAKQAAMAMKQMDKRTSNFKMIVSPPVRFLNDYFIKGGFKDGFEGFIICKTSAYYTFLKYMYLKLLNQGKSI